jgi:Domain of unknown function (DUF929)
VRGVCGTSPAEAKAEKGCIVRRSVVDWDRVDELRSKGWDWDRIAKDPKVGFHPDASVQDTGRALRGLYHRQRARDRRREPPAAQVKKEAEARERRWNLTRIGFLLVPIFAIWFILAYVIPSPVGLILPAIPYLALGLVVGAFILIFGLWRSSGPRWSRTLRTTLITGVVLGLVISGIIALGGTLFFGCPYLPSAASGTSQPQGWEAYSVSAWHEGGHPVFYYYGATWCPFCSASSWALWKALTEFQSGFSGGVNGIPGTQFMYSNPGDVYPSTPEVVLSFASVSSPAVSFQVSEYYWTPTNGASTDTVPSTGNCVQQAYVSAYAGGSIPFVVINGQYVHGYGTPAMAGSLVDPNLLSSYAGSGATMVASDVLTEIGSPWSAVQPQAALICAFVLKSDGFSTVSAFLSANPGLNNPSKDQWTSSMASYVDADLGSLG